jgi:hypothetical protein
MEDTAPAQRTRLEEESEEAKASPFFKGEDVLYIGDASAGEQNAVITAIHIDNAPDLYVGSSSQRARPASLADLPTC